MLKKEKQSDNINYVGWFLQLILLPIIGVVLLGAGFLTEVRNYARNKAGHKCSKCGSQKNLQVHHMCYQGVAKKHNVGSRFYNHPANAQLLCRSCHREVHEKDPLKGREKEIQMIMDLFRRIIRFYETNQEDVARWYNYGFHLVSLEDSKEILSEAHLRLSELKARKSKKG